MQNLRMLGGSGTLLQILVSAFLAILFLQSGIDKVVDRRGNIKWLKGHFAKSPLAGIVPAMVTAITILEIAAGALSAIGCVVIIFARDSTLAFYGAVISAIAISPKGTDAYLVYNAFTTLFQNNTTIPRSLVGVVKHADISGGVLGAFSPLFRSPPGDPRGSSQNNLWLEFLGDYVYAVATDTYGAAVWNDTRNALDCPAIDAWRAAAQLAIQNGTAVPTKPAPQQDCPATFGNSDIFGGSYPPPP